MTSQADEVARGDRFEFGKNWRQFLSVVDDDHIASAEQSLRDLLQIDRLDGMTFLDAGCGSGLFSLAAHRLGAHVHSFDYDPQSVACAEELRKRFASDDTNWTIEQGSVLDVEYLESLPKSDFVYSWGVLHHTGQMWQALEHVHHRVAVGGRLFVSLYHDQGGASKRWATIKKIYNRVPAFIRWMMVVVYGLYFELRSALVRLLRLQNPLPFHDWANKRRERGMSPWYDLVDWVGGYPFEVAKPEEVFDFYRSRGYTLVKLTTQGSGYGCNEFVYEKSPADEREEETIDGSK